VAEIKALILANGDLPDPGAVLPRIARFAPDLIIAADGGTRHAATLGLRPGAVVGDLDSAEIDPSRGIRIERHPVDKDETDLELAIRHAIQARAQSIAVVGATGGRLDMTVANLLLLLLPALASVRVEIWAGRQTAYVLRPPGGEIGGNPGDTISLLPLGGPAGDLTSTGLAFPLSGETLPVGPARGVSNRIVAAPASVELGSGSLLVVHSPAASDAEVGDVDRP
jgi:thiamine pyrophosphokinase